MAGRIKVRLKRDGLNVETSALLNSVFETVSPDIVIPVELAKRLGLWPPEKSVSTLLDTGGGEVVLPFYKSALELILEDRENKNLLVNVIVNPHISEVLISDYVASFLGIVLLDFKRGLWRLIDDPPNIVRRVILLKNGNLLSNMYLLGISNCCFFK